MYLHSFSLESVDILPSVLISFCAFYYKTFLSTTNNSKKTESIIAKKDEQSQKLAMTIQEMQSAMQKAAVEAAKAAAQQAA